jgi:hypothetical protein
MNFREATSEAAHTASTATMAVMERYAHGYYTDEDDISPALVERLQAELGGKVGDLKWQGSVMRHRAGVANEEGKTGADIAIFFELDTPSHKFKKGLLVQAKRSEPDVLLSKTEIQNLREQCDKMLKITPSSFVFNYSRRGLRSAPASKISGCTNRNLYGECDWTAYRFFLEFFRSPIGDPRFVSALAKDLPIPIVLELSASGEFHNERRLEL